MTETAQGSDAPLVLVVDDEPRVTEVVALTLRDEGFQVITATSGKKALEAAARTKPDLAILDIVMPGLDGQGLMAELRRDAPLPVIFLTGKSAVQERRQGLDLGADDYVVKPFHADELTARVRAVLRRSSAPRAGGGILSVGNLDIDFERRMLSRSGQPVQLSRIEWLLLQYLARNLGKVVLHTDLLRYVWGEAYGDDVQILRVCVSRLRSKLGSPSGRRGYIRTYVGVGYALEADADAGTATRRRRPRRSPQREGSGPSRRPTGNRRKR
jgi:two-component system, OmpR family, KDP operon response regulator KdpE